MCLPQPEGIIGFYSLHYAMKTNIDQISAVAGSRHLVAVTCGNVRQRHCDLINMAAAVSSRYSWFVSVSRKVGSYLFSSSLFIAQAATCTNKMDSVKPTKV